MKRSLFAALLTASAIAGAGLIAGPLRAADAPAVTAAIADPSRPATDVALDAERKPADILGFIGLKAGDKIADVCPGAYFDRLFADVVGPKGKVYMYFPTELVKAEHINPPPNGTSPSPEAPQVISLVAPINSFAVPQPVNAVFIRQNYHDLHDKFMGPADVPGFNAAVFKALKPGGVYVIVDHSAPDGSGLAATDTTHRIDAAEVKKEVTAAGFVFVGESDVLRNPADPRTALVFDKSIRGQTDQFVYKFRKPG